MSNFRGRKAQYLTRDGQIPDFCFIPSDPQGRIPVELSKEQVEHLNNLDPRCLTQGERDALAKEAAVTNFNYFLRNDGVACDPEEEYGFEASYYFDNGVWSGLYTNFVGLHYVRFQWDGIVTIITNYSEDPDEDIEGRSSKGWRVRSFASDQDHYHFPRMDLDPDELAFTREFVRTEWPSEMAEEEDSSMPIPVPFEDYLIHSEAA